MVKTVRENKNNNNPRYQVKMEENSSHSFIFDSTFTPLTLTHWNSNRSKTHNNQSKKTKQNRRRNIGRLKKKKTALNRQCVYIEYSFFCFLSFIFSVVIKIPNHSSNHCKQPRIPDDKVDFLEKKNTAPTHYIQPHTVYRLNRKTKSVSIWNFNLFVHIKVMLIMERDPSIRLFFFFPSYSWQNENKNEYWEEACKSIFVLYVMLKIFWRRLFLSSIDIKNRICRCR